MRVRCGACRTQFEVAGPGRFACPVCGSVNVVRNGAGGPEAAQSLGGYPAAPGAGMPGEAPPPPPTPPPVLPKIKCPECGFEFIVGEIAVATCPMCSAEVPTGFEEEEEDE
jgi:DNA-directed RNA polymerase subunit RPC12/RpoP